MKSLLMKKNLILGLNKKLNGQNKYRFSERANKIFERIVLCSPGKRHFAVLVSFFNNDFFKNFTFIKIDI